MEGRKLKPRMATANIPTYQRSLSGRLSGMFVNNPNLESNINRLEAKAKKIDDLITKYNVCNEFYEELINILDGDY